MSFSCALANASVRKVDTLRTECEKKYIIYEQYIINLNEVFNFLFLLNPMKYKKCIYSLNV